MTIIKKTLQNIWWLLLAGLLIRIGISFFDFSGDLNNHIAWGQNIVHSGLSGFYSRNFPKLYGTAFPNYPPVAMIFFAAMFFLYSLIQPIIWFLNTNIPLFPSQFVFFWEQQKIILPVFMKLPAIISDLFLAYFVYQIISRLKIRKPIISPQIGALLILLNPAFFYNSAYWGQIDSVPLCFLFGSLYYLLFKKKLFHSIFLFTIAVLSKQTIIIFAPLYALTMFNKIDIRKTPTILITSAIVFFAIFMPFSNNGNIIIFPFMTFIEKILTSFGSEYLTAHALNFWALVKGLNRIPDLSITWLKISVRYWSLLFVGSMSIIILVKLHQRKYNLHDLFTAGYLIGTTVFLFSTRMHERHLLIMLPFLLISSAYNQNVYKAFVFMSIFHFLNLYHGWWSPHPPEILIRLFDSLPIVNSLIIITICIYSYLLIGYIKKSYEKSA